MSLVTHKEEQNYAIFRKTDEDEDHNVTLYYLYITAATYSSTDRNKKQIHIGLRVSERHGRVAQSVEMGLYSSHCSQSGRQETESKAKPGANIIFRSPPLVPYIP